MTDALEGRKPAGRARTEGAARGMTSGIRRKASFLAAAALFEYAVQMALPVILVRHLTKQEFGDYRLMWLVTTTGLILFQLFLPQSLVYFLPRAAPGTRPKLVGNTFVSLFALGGLLTLLLLVLMPFFSGSIAGLQRHSPLVPIFVGTWLLASILDVLPNADGRTEWQACTTVGLAILRVAALSGAAIASRDVGWVLVAMCGVAIVKIGIAHAYALFAAQDRGLGFDGQLLRMQLAFALPFAVAEGLFALRVQADQWVVAANFANTAFALISIASMVRVVGTLIRAPLRDALLPRISSLEGQGKLDDARALIQKGYLLLGLVLPPILGLLMVTANEIVELIYTRAYLGAVPLMRIYLVGDIATVFAAGHLLQVFRFGRQAALVGAISLLLSIGLSILGLHFFELAGAVAGSTTSLVLWECWASSRVAKALGISIAEMIRIDQIWKVIVVVAGGVLVVHVLCSGLDTSTFLRLVVKSSVFVTVVLLGFVLTNMHRPLISLLREQRE
jgi:O-antigen/teichoic acid export membrane protein